MKRTPKLSPLILDSWEKVRALEKLEGADADGGPLKIFRGQGDSRWGLTPSLTRLLNAMGLSNPNSKKQVAIAVKAEEESIKIFQVAQSRTS